MNSIYKNGNISGDVELPMNIEAESDINILVKQPCSTMNTEIKVMATITNTWVYNHYDYKDGGTEYKRTTETYYHYNDVVTSAQEIAHENEQYIKKLAGNPPKNTDTPAVKIRTMQVGSGPVELLNPDRM